MNKKGPIVIIEDDPDDHEIFTAIFKKLNYNNEIVFFFDGEAALAYLNITDILPFIILCDINMPKLNGLELRKKIHTNAALQLKCTPYLFFTTSASQKSVIEAYSMSAQGFFIKDTTMEELEKTLRVMVEYWQRCCSPTQYEIPENDLIATRV